MRLLKIFHKNKVQTMSTTIVYYDNFLFVYRFCLYSFLISLTILLYKKINISISFIYICFLIVIKKLSYTPYIIYSYGFLQFIQKKNSSGYFKTS